MNRPTTTDKPELTDYLTIKRMIDEALIDHVARHHAKKRRTGNTPTEETREAMRGDRERGMSLRKIAKKHDVTLGAVRYALTSPEPGGTIPARLSANSDQAVPASPGLMEKLKAKLADRYSDDESEN